MTDVFISYSRKDIAFARKLNEGLEQGGIDTWIDWQDIPPSADWTAEMYAAIEQSDAFVFIISTESVSSEICSSEIQHARTNSKRLIPIVLDDIDPRQVDSSLAALNWIFFRAQDDFQKALTQLIEAIHVDWDWLKAHTRYQNRALDWDRQGQHADSLLRGGDLAQAEAWLSQAEGKDPLLTALQTQFLLASRKSQDQRQRRTLIGIAAGVLVTIALGLVAWSQRTEAVKAEKVRATSEAQAIAESIARSTAEVEARQEERMRATAQFEAEIQRQEAIVERDLATSKQLASLSRAHLSPDNIDFSLLMAVAAAQAQDTFEARSSLLHALTFRPHLVRILVVETGGSVDHMIGMAFDSDGKVIAAGTKDKTIALWNVESGKQIGEPFGDGETSISTLEFSPSGELVSGDHDAHVTLWNVENGEMLFQTRLIPDIGSSGIIEDIVVDPSGTYIAATTYHTIGILDVKQERWLYNLRDPYGRVWNLAFSPDGKILASGDSDDSYPYDDPGRVMLWDVASGLPIGKPLEGGYESANSVTFNPDGEIVAATSNTYRFDLNQDHRGEVHLWDVTSGQPIPHPLNRTPETVSVLEFLPDGKHMLITHGTEIQVHDVISGQDVARPFVFSHETATRLRLSPDGQWIAVATDSPYVFLYDLIDRLATIEHPLPDTDGATAMAFHPQDNTLAIAQCLEVIEEGDGCALSKVQLWDMSTLSSPSTVVETHPGVIPNMTYQPNGELSLGEEDTLHLAYSPDGSHTVSVAQDGTLQIWSHEAQNEDKLVVEIGDLGVTTVAFSLDGAVLAEASENGVQLLDSFDGHVLEEFLTGKSICAISYRPDGEGIIAGGDDGKLYAWHASNAQTVEFPFTGHVAPIIAVAISPGENLLVSIDEDGNMVLWDIDAMQPLTDPLPIDPEGLFDVRFSSSGERFAVLGASGVSVWDARLEAWQESACKIANHNITQEEWQRYLGDYPYKLTCPRQ